MMLQLKAKKGTDGPEIGKAKSVVNKLENSMRQGLERGVGVNPCRISETMTSMIA